MGIKQIQLFLINGFLGSGKTTFLIKLLSLFSSQKCGVLVNEFGEIGIDGLLLPQKDLELVEINGGSIFCLCRHENFINALIQFSTAPIEILSIEASGLADPVSMDNDLQIVTEKIGEVFKFSGSICLIDSLHFLDLLEVVQTIERQIQHASVVIINKIDLVHPDKVLEIKNRILSINPKIKLIQTSYGDLSSNQLMSLYSERSLERKSPPRMCATEKSVFDISLIAEQELNSQEIQNFFSKLAIETRRMKGFIQLDDGQWYYLDSVNGSFSLIKTKTTYTQTAIVVIFKEGVDNERIDKVWYEWESLATH